MYVFRAKDGQKGQKLKLNVTAKKSRNYRKIPFFIFISPGEIRTWNICANDFRRLVTKISMTSTVGLCAIVMVTNVISQHATVLALFSALSWIECVKCNDNLLYSSKTRHSTQETPSFKQKYIFKPFVRRIILFSWILVKAERLYWTAFGRFIATRPLHDRHIVGWISQLCSCWTASQIKEVNFSPRSERRSFCLETYESSNGKIAVLILESWICLEERSLK